ncbi:MAG TPA: DUF4139 domain-containing protein [Terriglobia bacterium]|nr:DUF4139 domain-containing protein [Terriglobia bacterium]
MIIRRVGVQALTMVAVAVLFLAGNSSAQTAVTSTQADQQQVMLTVYNSNIALVRDVRRVHLPTGQIELGFSGVAPQIEPASVQVVSRTAPKDFSVLEQDYRYDLLDPQKLLKKYVGKQITLVRRVTENNSTKEVPVKATLLADSNGLVWKVGDQIVTGMGADHYIFPALPAGLYSKPTLVWLVNNRFSGPQTLEADYLTKSVNWTANYILTLPAEKQTAALNAWVTINNQSGTAFRDAELQLVAGQVHRAAQEVRPMMRMQALKADTLGGLAGGVTEQPLSEYHLYTIQRKVSLPNNDSKQISLLGSSSIKFEKTFQVNGQSYYYYSPLQGGQPVKEPVQAHIKFKNSEANSLGVPLPAGVVRVYQTDANGNLELIGEDNIHHTPKDETLNLYIGNAFDVRAERKQTDFERLGNNLYEEAFQITLHNHKTEPISVEVNEPLGGQWTILNSNYKYEKISAFSVRFTVPVAAGGNSVLTYRVRIER